MYERYHLEAAFASCGKAFASWQEEQTMYFEDSSPTDDISICILSRRIESKASD